MDIKSIKNYIKRNIRIPIKFEYNNKKVGKHFIARSHCDGYNFSIYFKDSCKKYDNSMVKSILLHEIGHIVNWDIHLNNHTLREIDAQMWAMIRAVKNNDKKVFNRLIENMQSWKDCLSRYQRARKKILKLFKVYKLSRTYACESGMIQGRNLKTLLLKEGVRFIA